MGRQEASPDKYLRAFSPWLWQSRNLKTTRQPTEASRFVLPRTALSWLSVFLSEQCHSQRQRAQASEKQRAKSMALWKNEWKTTSRPGRERDRDRERGAVRRGPAEHQHPASLPAAAALPTPLSSVWWEKNASRASAAKSISLWVTPPTPKPLPGQETEPKCRAVQIKTTKHTHLPC